MMTKEELLKVAKPILFNTDMVQAILDGRKTVTRRVIKPQPENDAEILTDNLIPETEKYGAGKLYCFSDATVTSAPYNPDDILYVRETWQEWTGGYLYKAWPEGIHQPGYFIGMPWRPSIHMPKEAARIFLKVTNVRVERLQDIDYEQAKKEGCNDYSSTALGFCYLWDSTIKKPDRDRYGWEANPWVWVIEFEMVFPDV